MERPSVGQRPPKKERSFGKRNKGLRRTKSTKPKMSSAAKVQDAMLGKGRCWLTDYEGHNCTDGFSQRGHIVKQTIITDAFPHGAARMHEDEVWLPFDPIFDVEFVGSLDIRSVQEILDDPRNLVPVCPSGNVDGQEMIDALDELGYPEGFAAYKTEYGFEFNGRYWARVA